MNKIYTLIIGLLMVNLTYSQEIKQMDVMCDTLPNILKLIKIQKQIPMIIGESTNMIVMITMNPITGNWTQLFVTPDKNACVVATGNKLMLMQPETE